MTSRCLLIGGTSHAGKSTLAALAAQRLGRRSVSTDSLAKHPGRPWRDLPEPLPSHVVAYYRDLSLQARMQSVLAHYRAMWAPLVLPMIEGEDPLVLEGSALLPELVASVLRQDVRAVWLVAEAGVVERRVRQESDYAARGREARLLIDSFIERAEAFNRLMADEVERLGLERIDIADDTDSRDLVQALTVRR